jgi:hypothetical protein
MTSGIPPLPLSARIIAVAKKRFYCLGEEVLGVIAAWTAKSQCRSADRTSLLAVYDPPSFFTKFSGKPPATTGRHDVFVAVF